MNKKIKSLMSFVLICIMCMCTFSGCNLLGNSGKTYSRYVKALLDTNYKAEFTEYMEITQSTPNQAQSVYDQGLDYLATSLMSAYGIHDVENSDLHNQFRDLAKEIYMHAKYDVARGKKVDGVYQVEVTIYPIDILVTTYDEVVAYINLTNEKVENGDYNEYDSTEYELEYGQGILNILQNALPDIGNTEPVTITVSILDDGESYYISDADFLNLDKAILATYMISEDGTTGSTTDVNEEAGNE